MPNIFINADLGSNFKPIAFELIVKPLLLYKEDLEKKQEQLVKEAEILGEINLPEDSKYYDVLQKYKNSFLNFADAFYTQGYNYKTAAAANQLFLRRGMQITPLRKMIEEYNKFVDKDTERMKQSSIRSINPKSKSELLDMFYGGIAPDVQYRSGKDILERTGTVMAGLNNAFAAAPELVGDIEKQYHVLKEEQGFDSKSAMEAALTNLAQTNPELSSTALQIWDNMLRVYSSLGAEDFDTKGQKQIWDTISQGVIASIKAPKFSTLESDNSPMKQRIQADRERQTGISAFNAQTQRMSTVNNIKLSNNEDQREAEEHALKMGNARMQEAAAGQIRYNGDNVPIDPRTGKPFKLTRNLLKGEGVDFGGVHYNLKRPNEKKAFEEALSSYAKNYVETIRDLGYKSTTSSTSTSSSDPVERMKTNTQIITDMYTTETGRNGKSQRVVKNRLAIRDVLVNGSNGGILIDNNGNKRHNVTIEQLMTDPSLSAAKDRFLTLTLLKNENARDVFDVLNGIYSNELKQWIQTVQAKDMSGNTGNSSATSTNTSSPGKKNKSLSEASR